jgi:hypothetical protein
MLYPIELGAHIVVFHDVGPPDRQGGSRRSIIVVRRMEVNWFPGGAW